MKRPINFSSGPAMLPDEVLEQIHDELWSVSGAGASILEVSHRGELFLEIEREARHLLRQFARVPDTHEILFLQGGSRLQFSAIPLNLTPAGSSPEYIVSGTWSAMAAEEASRLIETRVLWNGESDGFRRTPASSELASSSSSAFLYYATNETIHGVQFTDPPDVAIPLVGDLSSDFLSRPIDFQRHSLVFACAQKNAGVAGLTIVVVDPRRLVERPQPLPGYLSYGRHLECGNQYNTPPTFSIYVLKLMLQWMIARFETLEGAEQASREKSALVYEALDRHPSFYRPHAERSCRSRMNVVFQLADLRKTDDFVRQAAERGMTDVRGHRTLGGIRAALYNALPREAAAQLAQFIDDFARRPSTPDNNRTRVHSV